MRKLNHIFLACCLLLAGMATSISMQAQDKTPITVDGCRPLLAPDCVIDDIIDEVGVLSDKHATYSNLLDADLTNGTTINTVLADIGLGYKPIVSIRDIKNVYKGGNGMKAGFMVADSKVSLLSLDLLKTFVISLYNDNQLVYTAPINDLDGTLLNLGLVDFGEKGGKMEFSISVPEKDKDGKELIFDEIALGTTGVNLDVLKTLSFYYGFVGESRTEINWANFGTELTSSPDIPLIGTPQNYLVDGNSDTYQSWSLIGGLLGKSCYIKTNGIVPQLQQKEIGFVYSAHDLISLSVLPTVTITFIKSGPGLLPKTDKHTVEAQLLGASVLSGQQIIYSAAPTMGFEWDKVEISFGALKVEAGVSHLHYAFVRNIQIPDEAKKHALNLSSDALLCENETEYTLTSDVKVTWSLKQVLDLDGKTDKTEACKSGVTINPTTLTKSAKVTFATPAGAGIYIFKATDEDGCTETVTLTRGKTQEMEDASASWFCGIVLNKEADKVHLENPKGGALISIDKLNNAENILDGNLNTYASYAKGLQLAAHTGIVSIKKDEGTFGEDASVVGFVAETPNSLLGTDVLKFYNIVLYKDGKQVYSSVVSENNTVQAALLGAPGSAKVRYAIEVPHEYIGKFDEFTLFTSGVLTLDLTGKSLKIYGAFVSDDPTCIKPSDPLDHLGVASITSQNTGATFNYSKTGNAGLVKAVTVLANLGYLLDGTSLTDDGADKGAVSYAVANVLGSTDITVKTGRKFSGKRWVGFVIKVPTGIGDVDLLTDMEIKAYNNGMLVGDGESGSFLSVNLIGWTDYAYISCYTTQAFDEVTFTNKKLIEALKGVQYLGFYTYADKDGDGIPDEEDPDFCEPPVEIDLNPSLSDINSICESSTEEKLEVKIWAEHVSELAYSLRDIDKSKIIEQGTLKSISDPVGHFEHTIDFQTLNLSSGRYEFEVWMPNKPLFNSVRKSFVVHPTRTYWMPKNNSTDWNLWENWSDGVPVIGCTDVVIPGQSATFPVLKAFVGSDVQPADYNSCKGIHFGFGAEMLGTQHLNYDKAWMDLELSLGRYYMLSVPLKGMYTGDFFVSKGMNGVQSNDFFTPLDTLASPEERFAPRVLQRLWACSAPIVEPIEVNGPTDAENGKGKTVSFDETRWTPPFNALAQSYALGQGFSLKAEKGDLKITKILFRFPKEHEKYFYYNENGFMTDLYETLDREDNGRLFTDDFSGELTLNYTLETNSQIFLVGNPFMAHINIKKFMQINPSIKSIKIYNGNVSNSLILSDEELQSNGEEWTHIAPMQSVFVEVADTDKNTLQVRFTEDMLELTPGSQQLRVALQKDATQKTGLVITATTDTIQAQARVIFNEQASCDYVPGEDASLLVDQDIVPHIAIYTVAGEKAADIQQTPETDCMMLGMWMKEKAPVTLRIEGVDSESWHLYDALTHQLYDVTSNPGIRIENMQTNIGRYLLVRGDAMERLSLGTDNVVITIPGNGMLQVLSTDATVLTSCEVYNAEGRLVSQWRGEAPVIDGLKATHGVNLVHVRKANGDSYTHKIICY